MPENDNTIQARSADEIFAGMHRQLRIFDSNIPESPDRLDPIMRILLRLFADQLSGIDQRLDQTWQEAADVLIRSVAPEARHWPIPAYTVMRCRPSDPVVEVDSHTRFYYKEKREGAIPLFFSSLKTQKMLAAEVRHAFVRVGETVVDCSPGQTIKTPPPSALAGVDQTTQVFIAVDYQGPPSALENAQLFVKAQPDAAKQLRWGRWYPGSAAGSFYDDVHFCPGLTSDISSIVSREKDTHEWGGLRTSDQIFTALQDSFVVLPTEFTSTWELGRPDEQLQDIIARAGTEAIAGESGYYWLRIDLPENGDRGQLFQGLDLYFDCALVVNRNELTLFKHTGSSSLVEIELTEPLPDILEINSVVDSEGRSYRASYEIDLDPDQRTYAVQQRDGALVLWFDFTAGIETPPDSLTVTYATTAGTAANSVETGKITELYESHPGLAEVANVIPTAGAIPARSEAESISEVALRLRDRNRALTFDEISRWVRAFDPRVQNVACENGVQRAERGLRRCVVVWVNIDQEKFHSDDERELLRRRLLGFLKARSTVNTQFQVEIVKR